VVLRSDIKRGTYNKVAIISGTVFILILFCLSRGYSYQRVASGEFLSKVLLICSIF